MIISNATLAALNVQVDNRFQGVFAGTPTIEALISTTVPSVAGMNVYPFLLEAMKVRRWVNERMSKPMRARNYSLENVPFEATFVIPRSAIADDTMGLYMTAILDGFAKAVRLHREQEILAMIAANPTCFDGGAFFATNHASLQEEGGTAYSNDMSEDIDPTDLETAMLAIDAIRTQMASYVDANGEPMGANLTHVVCPTQKSRVLRTIASSETIAQVGAAGGTVTNVLKGTFEVIESARLNNAPTVTYFCDLSQPIKPFLWQSRSNPKLVPPELNQPDAFKRDRYVWGIDGDDGAAYRGAPGVSFPQLCIRNTDPT